MSQIVIFGGTGYAGSNIAREAVQRGHAVTSYSRNVPAEPVEGVEYRTGSVADAELTFKAAQEADEVVVAVHAENVGGDQTLLDVLPSLQDASIRGGARLSFVGGAGSSYVAEGGPRLIDTPEFQDEWRPTAQAHADVLTALEAAPAELDWFYVSPAALFGSWAAGETTGAYRTGGDVLVTKEDGSSEISGTDFALAFVDEIEQRNHVNRRFTVGH